ncbi:hypothetical protein HX109_04240 [Galbibacter sp. BG1]|uniref:hypothetical protein n=1 Tax=Galbibacter sp. BG1 TaxID=1170699 RepID=UPI0015BA38C6|nr:hypothetical protein [Galbibacter sp. BG1]QLE00811.1 hypothetical protein HX109_04240 [Galbibacter sp. BG1]
MKKLIDIEEDLLYKLKLLAVHENMSVKALMEKAVAFFVEHKQNLRAEALSDEEKEDLGLLLLMNQAENDSYVSEEEIMKALKE